MTIAAGLCVDAAAAEEPPKVTASMQCDRAADRGRVKCAAEVRTTGGRSIAWADVVLVELPAFTAALKGRIGPADATTREPELQRWAFGLIAKRAGEGEVKARLRVVVCELDAGDAGSDSAAPRCTPVAMDIRTTVHVG